MRQVTNEIKDKEMFTAELLNNGVQRVYVCSPLSAPTDQGIRENMFTARKKCYELNFFFDGCGIKAVAPHAYLPEFLDDNNPVERELAIQVGMAMLEKCQAIYIFGDRLSDGMKAEIEYAYKKHMHIYADGPVEDAVGMYLFRLRWKLKGRAA